VHVLHEAVWAAYGGDKRKLLMPSVGLAPLDFERILAPPIQEDQAHRGSGHQGGTSRSSAAGGE